MKYNVNFAKRSLILLLVAWITFTSVFFAYQESTECAEWIAGTIASIAGGPILTALVIGGVVVAGGVALYELSQTSVEDHRAFVDGIKNGFEGFVAEQEAKIAKEENSSLTDQEAADIGVANARETVNNFVRNAVDVTVSTGKNLKAKTVAYWKLFSSILGDTIDNGLPDVSVIPSPDNPVNVPIYNNSIGITTHQTNIYNTFGICLGYYYISKGIIYDGGEVIDRTDSFTDTYCSIPFVWVSSYNDRYVMYDRFLNISISNGEITNKWISSTNTSHFVTLSQLNSCTLPIFFSESWTGDTENYVLNNYRGLFAVSNANGEDVPIWLRSLNSSISNTHMGQAIQTGRRQLVNSGDHIISVFQEDSVPVKKSGVEVNEGVVSAPVGWDIPAGNTWDDVFLGNKPFSDVVDDTGCVSVPSDDIIGANPTDTVVDYPVTTDVQDSADYPKTDVDDPSWTDEKPQDTPDKPYQDILDNQGGSFYPAAMDISELFPFCIPFDIYYLVQKFTVQQGEAPVITIPIVYPRAIQGAMGSDHYDVVIDLNDYIMLRNIIRIFLLLLFIIGLMQITRNLIRG